MKTNRNMPVLKAAAISLIASTIALSACSAPATPAAPAAPAPAAGKKTITFSPLALAIPALKGLSEGVKGVGASKGYDVIVVDPNFEPPKQAQQLQELINSGRTHAAWVIAINPGSMKPVLDLAKEKKVVMVVNGVPADYGYNGLQPGITFSRINYEAFGGGVGDLLGQCVKAKLGGNAKVIFMQSQEGAAGKKEQEDAMLAKLAAAAPGAKIVANIITKDRAGAQTSVSQALQANPDANAVMTTTDEGGLGALGAFKAAGKPIPCIANAGGNDEVLAAVKSGEMYGAAVLQFQKDLMQTFDAIETMLKDPSAPGKQKEVPLELIKSP
ncbi:MAG: substrate-binding domain-containing protein [Anaerolineae bacterium]|nr:substrate-binding domain-containing protein [Anaerolineae bacterium]